MKYQSLFPILLMLASSSCTNVASIEPAKSMETKPPPTIDGNFTVTALPTLELQRYSAPTTQPFQSPSSSGLDILIKEAKEDLAQRLGVSIDGITVVVVVGQEFSSDAFYCKATKERIARDESPTVIFGVTILLQTAEQRYEYHAADQTVIFCRKVSQ